MKDYHYVYRLEAADGRFYIGSRTSKTSPEKDTYMGSGAWPKLCKQKGIALSKSVLSLHSTRELACSEENRVILASKLNNKCQNLSLNLCVPFMGRRTNAYKTFIESGITRLGAKAVCIYVYLVGLGSGLGISTRVIASANNCTKPECNNLLEQLCSFLEETDLPKVYKKDQETWGVA